MGSSFEYCFFFLAPISSSWQMKVFTILSTPLAKLCPPMWRGWPLMLFPHMHHHPYLTLAGMNRYLMCGQDGHNSYTEVPPFRKRGANYGDWWRSKLSPGYLGGSEHRFECIFFVEPQMCKHLLSTESQSLCWFDGGLRHRITSWESEGVWSIWPLNPL